MHKRRSKYRASGKSQLTLLLLLAGPAVAFGQGCVASRGAGLTGVHDGVSSEDGGFTESSFDLSSDFRWFRSHRHFIGDVEQVQRAQQHTEVINNSNFLDIGLGYSFTNRFRMQVVVPFALSSRSQAVTVNGEVADRFKTNAAGIGDVRVLGDFWVLPPDAQRRWNILFGLGFSAPTGNDSVKDVFEVYDKTSGRILAKQQTVDESIQLGTGAWALLTELYAYRQIGNRWLGYLEGSYTFATTDTNGVPTYRSNPYEAITSVADAFLLRAGLDFAVAPEHGLHVSLGGRWEGVPVRNVFSGSQGFRRPGYTVSIEPGVLAVFGSYTVSMYTPVAVYRTRLRSIPDIEESAATGTYQHGDAAFADYSIILGFTKRL